MKSPLHCTSQQKIYLIGKSNDTQHLGFLSHRTVRTLSLLKVREGGGRQIGKFVPDFRFFSRINVSERKISLCTLLNIKYNVRVSTEN